MPIMGFIIAVTLVGIVLYLVNRFVTMDPGVKRFLNIAVIVLLVIWFLQAIGLFRYLAGMNATLG